MNAVNIPHITSVWYVVEGGCRLSYFPSFLNWYDLYISVHNLAMDLIQEKNILPLSAEEPINALQHLRIQ